MDQLIPINGHNLNVELSGSSNDPAILLLHHGLGSIGAWKAQMTFLTSSGFFVIAYDRWGYGKSDPRSEYGMPYFHQDLLDLEALVDWLGLQQLIFIGHSDGGKIAMYYTLAHPEVVLGVVLVSTHIYVEPKMEVGIQKVLQDYEHRRGFREHMLRVHGQQADQLFYGWYHGWLNPANLTWDMRPEINAISCPTLVIQGLEDEHATPQQAQAIADAIPGAELHLIADTGHMLPQDSAETFNRLVIEFFSNHIKHPSHLRELSE